MLITIARFTYPYEAQIAWSKLDALGVPAYIADEHTINMQWLYSNALGGVRLQVREEDEQAALLALAEDLETELMQQEGFDTDLCPVCDSPNTEFYQFGKRWAFLIFLGLDFPLFPVKEGIQCRDCGAKSKIDGSK
ncbi:hypothetical protein MED121_14374 [Marinomonas sp. MED121]|uniref:putative signal transducing protein n=1 Tax=Marinomonas sp. MED121 TaxID=314277 RepID=UPI0000691213|nr:DUF2007 domain-containing protein [Marinomonas sp. MED121]EAQ67120.1 hypothetical protein MED121_14374 [Marinomonas sp. MED121]